MKQSLGSKPNKFLALIFAVSLISMIFIALPLTASAQTSVSQCNGTDNVGGQAVECHYTITNNVDGDATSSTITISECHGAANDPATLVCTPSTTTSTSLVTSIDQCNGSGNGGGGTVLCTVDVINNITGTMTPTAATVNQCNVAGTGGGTEPTTMCSPFPANTTGATVTQCNEAGTGGGGTVRVQCSVDSDSTTTPTLNVTVNQCIGSGNGGGATVTCRTGITNNVTAPEPEPEPEPSNSGPGPNPNPSNPPGGPGEGPDGGPDDNDAGGDDSGGGDDTDTGGADRGETTGQVVNVPVGGASAGGGSTSGVENLTLLVLGLIMMITGSAYFLRRRVAARI
jgi:hypothetical protein